MTLLQCHGCLAFLRQLKRNGSNLTWDIRDFSRSRFEEIRRLGMSHGLGHPLEVPI